MSGRVVAIGIEKGRKGLYLIFYRMRLCVYGCVFDIRQVRPMEFNIGQIKQGD